MTLTPIKINFRTGRGDFCKEEARRIRNGPGQQFFTGLAKDTENRIVCMCACVCVPGEAGSIQSIFNHLVKGAPLILQILQCIKEYSGARNI